MLPARRPQVFIASLSPNQGEQAKLFHQSRDLFLVERQVELSA